MSLLPQLGSIDGRCSAAKGDDASIVVMKMKQQDDSRELELSRALSKHVGY